MRKCVVGFRVLVGLVEVNFGFLGLVWWGFRLGKLVEEGVGERKGIIEEGCWELDWVWSWDVISRVELN